MKKLLVFALMLTVAAVCAACSATPSLSPSPSPSESLTTPPPSSESSSESSESFESESSETSAPEKISVADAAMYRGTVVKQEADGDAQILTLEQADGTDFGAAALRFRLGADTPLSFEKDQLVNGAYLEVFYGVAPGQTLNVDETHDVIGANLYPEAAMVNFNGTVMEFLPEEKLLMMEDLNNGQTVAFHYGDETQLYLTLTDIQKGDKLNIFHRGVFTLSLPPQGNSLEIRPYKTPVSTSDEDPTGTFEM